MPSNYQPETLLWIRTLTLILRHEVMSLEIAFDALQSQLKSLKNRKSVKLQKHQKAFEISKASDFFLFKFKKLSNFYLHRLKSPKSPFVRTLKIPNHTSKHMDTLYRSVVSNYFANWCSFITSLAQRKVVHTLMSFQTTQKLSGCALLNWKYITNSSATPACGGEKVSPRSDFCRVSCRLKASSFKGFGELIDQSTRRWFIASLNEHFTVLKALIKN